MMMESAWYIGECQSQNHAWSVTTPIAKTECGIKENVAKQVTCLVANHHVPAIGIIYCIGYIPQCQTLPNVISCSLALSELYHLYPVISPSKKNVWYVQFCGMTIPYPLISHVHRLLLPAKLGNVQCGVRLAWIFPASNSGNLRECDQPFHLLN